MQVSGSFHKSNADLSSEQDLIQKAKENPAYFEKLYNLYYEQILKFVYQRVNGKEEAYDITTQVFLKAMLNLAKYEFKGVPFSAWLYRIAINELNMLFRKNKTQHTINADIESLQNIKDELQDNSEDEERIEKILNTLPLLNDDELQIIEMRFFEKRSFKEIGEIIGITENNAKVKTYRILDKVKQLIVTKSY